MIIDNIDESLDEEVFAIDFTDGNFTGTIECDWSLDPGEWLLAFGYIDGPEYLGFVFDLDNIETELRFLDPRFIDGLMDAEVHHWWWGEQSFHKVG